LVRGIQLEEKTSFKFIFKQSLSGISSRTVIKTWVEKTTKKALSETIKHAKMDAQQVQWIAVSKK
jgi:hypothetical protein